MSLKNDLFNSPKLRGPNHEGDGVFYIQECLSLSTWQGKLNPISVPFEVWDFHLA